MTTFYLVRHGKKESKNEFTSLSDIGIKQAELTAKYFKSLNISSIYASPLKRTQQTAEIISKEIKIPIVTDDKLRERMEWVPVEESFEDFLKEWDKTSIDRNYKPPIGDSSYKTGDRVKAVLEKIADSNSSILVVTHGGAIGDFLRNIFSDEQLSLKTRPLSSIKYVEISECSITEVQKINNEYALKRVNDVSHLPIPIL